MEGHLGWPAGDSAGLFVARWWPGTYLARDEAEGQSLSVGEFGAGADSANRNGVKLNVRFGTPAKRCLVIGSALQIVELANHEAVQHYGFILFEVRGCC